MGWRAVFTTSFNEGGRFVGKAILNEDQYCLHTMLNDGGYSAYQVAFGPNPVDLYSQKDYKTNLDFAQTATIPSQVTPQ